MAARRDRFLVWGAGGHGKVVADVIRSCGHEVAGYIDRDPAKLRTGERREGVDRAWLVVDEAQYVLTLRDDRLSRVDDRMIALAIGRNEARLAVAGLVPPERLPVLAHPSAEVSGSAVIGAGTVVMPRAVVNADARVGRAVIVNTGAIVEHDCVVEDGVHVSPGAVLLGNVYVGERSWIGAAAVVLPGVRIGRDVMVGAGAVVIRDVPDHLTVVGNPARPKERAGQ